MHWPGIEPGPPAWQASILPLNHQCLLNKVTHTITLLMNAFSADMVSNFINGHLLEYNKHWWFSDRMLACHAGGPGSIPGQCIFCSIFLVRK